MLLCIFFNISILWILSNSTFLYNIRILMEFKCKNMFPRFQTTKLLEAFHNSVPATSPVLFPATSNTLTTLKHSVFSMHAWLLASTLTSPFICNEFPTSSPILQISDTYPTSMKLLCPTAFCLILLMQVHPFLECFLGTYISIPSTSPWGPWMRKSCMSHLWHLQHFMQSLQYSRWSFKDLLREWICQPQQGFQKHRSAFSSSEPEEPLWWSS